MTRKIDDGRGKLEVMEEEGEKLYQQCKALNKQLRAYNAQIHSLEQDNTQLKDSNHSLTVTAAKKEAEWQSRQSLLEQTIDDLRRKVGTL